MPKEPIEKPGYLTSEFWVSVLTVAAIIAKLFGIDVNQDDVNALAISIAGLVGGSLAVWGIVSRYTKSRSAIKVARLEAKTVQSLATSGQPVTYNLTRN